MCKVACNRELVPRKLRRTSLHRDLAVRADKEGGQVVKRYMCMRPGPPAEQ